MKRVTTATPFGSKLVLALLVSLALVLYREASAQVRFPFGNKVNLNTSEGIVYLETRLLFYTGKYKANDYQWRKISDSLDGRWLVTACFNGDCKNDLLDSGRFITDFGLNDTTCFIAFHVESHGFNGTSAIRYKVINTNDSTDQAELTYNITYTGTSAAVQVRPAANEPVFYPNPATNEVRVAAHKGECRVVLTDITGKSITEQHGSGVLTLQTGLFARGIYFITIESGDTISTRKLVLD